MSGFVRVSAFLVVLAVDTAGYLDAIVRFPAVPTAESFFCVKLLLSVVLKTVSYCLGFVDIHRNTHLFLASLFINVWLLPVLYVLVIPYGDSSPFRDDKDVFRTCMDALKNKSQRAVVMQSVRQLLTLSYSRNKGPCPSYI